MAENNFPLTSGGNLLYPILRKLVKHFIVYIIKVHSCKVDVLWVNMVESENFQ